MIEIKGLRKKYGEIEAVKDVDFSVDSGEVFCLLGSNGAGKTTIIKILLGLLDPTDGTALIDGKEVKDKVSLKKNFGYMPEQPHLHERLTGYEFLDIMGSLKGMNGESLKKSIKKYSKDLELDERINMEMGAYSKGMKQKVLFVNSILHDPPNLILDEPTVGLDPRYSQYMKKKINEFSKEGKNILMTTHITTVAEEVADVVGIIDKGSLLIKGSQEELKESTGTKSLERAFIEVIKDERKSA